MRSSYRQTDGVVVLTIVGRIDTPTAAVEFEYLITRLPGPGVRVLDLTEVTALGAAGLSVLARAATRGEHGLVIVIGERHDVVLRAVESARLLASVRLFDRVEHALAAQAQLSNPQGPPAIGTTAGPHHTTTGDVTIR